MKQKKKKHSKNQNLATKPQQQKQAENNHFQAKNEKVVEIDKNSKYALPITEIKRDLFKTFAYGIFAAAVIIALYYFLPKSGLQLNLGNYKFF